VTVTVIVTGAVTGAAVLTVAVVLTVTGGAPRPRSPTRASSTSTRR